MMNLGTGDRIRVFDITNPTVSTDYYVKAACDSEALLELPSGATVCGKILERPAKFKSGQVVRVGKEFIKIASDRWDAENKTHVYCFQRRGDTGYFFLNEVDLEPLTEIEKS